MLKKLLLVFCLVASLQALALDQFSINTAAGTREQQISADIARLWRVSDSRLFLGVGLRGTSQWSSGQTFTTAPSNLTTGEEGPHTIFLKDKKENIDDLVVASSQVTSINIALYALFEYSENWSFGTNIDLIGGSFGKKQSAKYNPKSDDANFPDSVSARPTGFNLLLISDNDKGSLNSEFFAKRKINEKWALKMGVNFAFTEYTTTSKLRKGNDRFRHKALLPTIGFIRNF